MSWITSTHTITKTLLLSRVYYNSLHTFSSHVNLVFVLSFACMGGLRGSEITDDKIDCDDRTLFLENIHFFRSSVEFDGDIAKERAESDPSIVASKTGIERFCIPTSDRKSVLDIAKKIKDWEVVWSFDDHGLSMNNFRGMFLTQQDLDARGQDFELKRPNRCAIFFPETKVGPVYV